MSNFNINVFNGIAAEFRTAIDDRLPDSKREDRQATCGAIEARLIMVVSDDESVRATVAEEVDTFREAHLYAKTIRNMEAGAATVEDAPAEEALTVLLSMAEALGVNIDEDSVRRLRGETVAPKGRKAPKVLDILG